MSAKTLKIREKRNRTISEKFKLYDAYYKRSGLYTFIIKNLIKLAVILVGIVGLIIGLNFILLSVGIDMTKQLNTLIASLSTWYVVSLFFVSESILGWLPPDLFIVWGKTEPSSFPYLNVTFLAIISYAGGIVAYHLGDLVQRFPKIHGYIQRKYSSNFILIRKWGGIVVVMAALFPLPFATISTIAGMVRYPFKQYLLFGLTRFLRFYVYAIWIFWGLDFL